ncbi:MAG: gamma-glutamyltransferase [Verrucomicrobia bacterium]|nr:gamma-glutamyltransferase [Verrucomicrobiota bacterium]
MNATVLIMSSLALPLLASAAARPGTKFATRSETIAPHGMVCTSHALASQIGLDILKQGGSAVDAAIAADAALGLMEPMSCGIGGDLFAIVWDAKSQRLHGLNASGRSPYILTIEHFRTNGLSKVPSYGPLPVTVPGCVDGWFELHKKFGKLPMKTILAATIQYGREGFPVPEVIAGGWPSARSPQAKYPNFLETYNPGGVRPRKGEVFRNPDLARTLERIARGGRNAFYKGDLARTVSAYMLRHGGFITERDLADHRSTWVEPVSTSYRGYDVWELPPNGQGIAALQMLNVLEGYDLKTFGFGSPEHMHLFIEAKKLAFEDRARHYGDPEFSRIPVKQLISKRYGAERRKLLAMDKAAPAYEPGRPELHGDTIYLTVADAKGNMVSFIQSNYRGMGSGMTPDGLGFCLQDRGEGFNITDEKHPNFYAPHKRPFHTIIPAFVTRDGKPWMSFGVMGGDMQPQGHVQILLNLIDFGMNLQEAGDAPRIYHVGSTEPNSPARMTDGGTVNVEEGFPLASLEALRKMGHKLGRTSTGAFGGYQAIRWDATNKVYIGATESRKDGQAVGY